MLAALACAGCFTETHYATMAEVLPEDRVYFASIEAYYLERAKEQAHTEPGHAAGQACDVVPSSAAGSGSHF